MALRTFDPTEAQAAPSATDFVKPLLQFAPL
jgi:hypothetical protein